MGEILLPACQFPRLSDGATCRDIHAKALCQACTAHIQVAALRTRLESVEAARRDAQESRMTLIIENEELGAELADLRTRLESEVVRLREALTALVKHCDLGHTHAVDGRRQAYLKALDAARKALENANG